MSDAPQELFDEAFQLNYALYSNAMMLQEVVSWADGWIERLDSWPDEITEISLGGLRKDLEVRRSLAELAQRGHPSQFPELLTRQWLGKLEDGGDPFKGVAELYPLVYDHFDAGGLEFRLLTPESIRQAIYQLDYDIESTDPLYGWIKTPDTERQPYLRERMKHELIQALLNTT